jgi:serine---pyruvate transaminase
MKNLNYGLTLKEILLTPGPTQIPLQVFEAMQIPTLHHRTETFKKFLKEARNGIQWITRSSTLPIFIAGSGTAAMEAALVNTCKPNQKIAVLNAGKFGERWSLIGKRIGLDVSEITAPLGESISSESLSKFLESHSPFHVFCLQYCESSTAVQHNIHELCKIIKTYSPHTLTIVDAVSAIGTLPIYVDALHVDVLVAAAHKGLMLTPGLSMVIANEQAWKHIEQNGSSSFYFDLITEKKSAEKDTTAWTPAMNQIVGLARAIEMIRTEAEEKVYHRHAILAEATRCAIKSLGLNLLAKTHPSVGLTAAILPKEINAETFRKQLFNKHAIRIAGGQDELKDSVVRIGHMGYCSKNDLLSGLEAFEATLNELSNTPSKPSVLEESKNILNKLN